MHLIYYGNENLQKTNHMVWNYDGTRNATASEVQAIAQSRMNGSSVVNTRKTAKEIDITGFAKVLSSQTLTNLITEYDKIFENEENQNEHYLRIIRSYLEIIPTNTTTGWTASDDAASLAVNSTAGTWQHGGSSLGFDIDVSASANDYATLTYTGTAYDLSSKTDTGNFEFWLYIPDAYYVSSVEFRIGNDSSNYYSYIFSSDYQGNAIHNGINLFSAGWSPSTYSRPSKRFAETGTVNDAVIDYCVVIINYNASAVDITGCYLDGIFWVDENQLRNFPAYRQGMIKRTGQHYENDYTPLEVSFINHTGYAVSTQSWELFSTVSCASTVHTKVIDLDGSLNPFPKTTLDIKTATSIGSFSLKNLNNSQQIDLLPSALAADDQVVFGDTPTKSTKNNIVMDFDGAIPTHSLGNNRTQLQVIGSSETLIEQALYDSLYTSGRCWQQFTATATATVNTVEIYGVPNNYQVHCQLYTSGAGDTIGTAFGSLVTTDYWSGSGYQWLVITGLNALVVSGTKYWIRCYTTGETWPGINWAWSTSNPYGGGICAVGGYPYSYLTTRDFAFRIRQTTTPAWLVNWSMEYKKLYSA
jgi:hypothetical protein